MKDLLTHMIAAGHQTHAADHLTDIAVQRIEAEEVIVLNIDMKDTIVLSVSMKDDIVQTTDMKDIVVRKKNIKDIIVQKKDIKDIIVRKKGMKDIEARKTGMKDMKDRNQVRSQLRNLRRRSLRSPKSTPNHMTGPVHGHSQKTDLHIVHLRHHQEEELVARNSQLQVLIQVSLIMVS